MSLLEQLFRNDPRSLDQNERNYLRFKLDNERPWSEEREARKERIRKLLDRMDTILNKA